MWVSDIRACTRSHLAINCYSRPNACWPSRKCSSCSPACRVAQRATQQWATGKGHLHSYRHWDVQYVVVSKHRALARLLSASIFRAWRIIPLYKRPRHLVSAACCNTLHRAQARATHARTTRFEASSFSLSILPSRANISTRDLMAKNPKPQKPKSLKKSPKNNSDCQYLICDLYMWIKHYWNGGWCGTNIHFVSLTLIGPPSRPPYLLQGWASPHFPWGWRRL